MIITKCRLCGAEFTESLQYHLWAVHYGDIPQPLSNKIVYSSFIDSIQQTIKNSIITGKCCCPMCGYAFDPDIFFRHIQETHPDIWGEIIIWQKQQNQETEV